MLKNAIRFIAVVAAQTIYETALRLLVAVVISKVVAHYLNKDVTVETDESTDSEEI